jgi:glycosyltransferase involved in cell wall biosynthesis
VRRDTVSHPSRCLWISRYLPYPIDSGATLYSAKLAESLAATGITVRYLGFGGAEAMPRIANIEWCRVPGGRRHPINALFTTLPVAAAIDATSEYSALLETQLRESWDLIVLDGYGTGWALRRCNEYRRARGAIIVHVSHNHEAALWRSMARNARCSTLQRAMLWQNAWRANRLERRLVRVADLVTTITPEDGRALGAHDRRTRILTLLPGYDGPIVAERAVDVTTPRRVLLVGSFHWVVKQENLRQFVTYADARFHAAGIELDVVGDIPEALRLELSTKTRATRFHGFASDLRTFARAARFAVVPEVIGGGFKMKFLDYFFSCVPVAALSHAATGLPDELRRHVLLRDDLPSLVQLIVDYIDRVDLLDDMQRCAFKQATKVFRWEDRGRVLRTAVSRGQRIEAPQPASAHMASPLTRT